MKHVVALVCLVTFSACAKEKDPLPVAYMARCRMCSIEWEQDGDIHRDTIFGQFNYVGGKLVDTGFATSRWNVVLEDGERMYLRGCHLRHDSIDGNIELTTDIGDRCDSWGGECSTIDRVFHQ